MNVMARAEVYVTKNIAGISGAEYCIEYKEASTSGEWYVNAIYVKGLDDDANAAPVEFEIPGGANLNVSSEKFSTATTSVIRASHVGNPDITNGVIYNYTYGNFEEGYGNFTQTVSIKNNNTGADLVRHYGLKLVGAFSAINNMAFLKDTRLHHVILADGENGNYISLNKIGNGAFGKCTGMVSFRHFSVGEGNNLFPSAIRNIENFAFDKSGLTGIVNIPTGCNTVGVRAFGFLDKITTVIFRNEVSVATTQIEMFAFHRCANLVTVELQQNVKSIGLQSFATSPKIAHVSFGEGLESIGDLAFNDMSSTDDLILPTTLKRIGNDVWGRLEGSTGEIIGWKFYNGITLPEGIEEIGNFAFCGSRKVETLNLPSTLKRIGNNSFATVPLVGTLTIPSSVEHIGVSAFAFCGGLERVVFETNSKLDMQDRPFMACNGLRYVDMSKVNSETLLTNLQSKKVKRDSRNTPLGMLQKYTLVYLPENFTYENKSSFMADGQENFIMRQSAGDATLHCDTFVVYDEDDNYKKLNLYANAVTQIEANSETLAQLNALRNKYLYSVRGCDYEIPYEFTANNASYKRKFTSNGLNIYTVSLPYAGAQLQEGVKAYKLVKEMDLAGSANDNGLWFVSLDDDRLTNKSDLERANKLEGDHPYVLRFSDVGLFNTLKFEATNTNVKESKSLDEPIDNSQWRFVNTNVNIYNAEAAAQKLYMLKGSTKTWHAVSTDNTNGFFHSFRGAMNFTGTGEAKDFPAFLEDIETSGMVEVAADSEMVIYTIGGVRIEGSFDNVAPGLYIVNGKKMIKR